MAHQISAGGVQPDGNGVVPSAGHCLKAGRKSCQEQPGHDPVGGNAWRSSDRASTVWQRVEVSIFKIYADAGGYTRMHADTARLNELSGQSSAARSRSWRLSKVDIETGSDRDQGNLANALRHLSARQVPRPRSGGGQGGVLVFATPPPNPPPLRGRGKIRCLWLLSVDCLAPGTRRLAGATHCR